MDSSSTHIPLDSYSSSGFPPPPPPHGASPADPYHPLPLPMIRNDHRSMQDIPCPPGTVISLMDEHGYPRYFHVNYDIYQMPQSQAVAYVDFWQRNTYYHHHRQHGATIQTMAPFIKSSSTMSKPAAERHHSDGSSSSSRSSSRHVHGYQY